MVMHVIVAGHDVILRRLLRRLLLLLPRRWRVVMHIKRMRVVVTASHRSSMAMGHVGQGEAQLLPEQLVAPLQVRVGFEVQPNVWVEILVRHLAQQNDNETAPPVAQHLMMGGLELEPTPLGLDEVLRQHHDRSPRGLDSLHDRVGDVGTDREVTIVQT